MHLKSMGPTNKRAAWRKKSWIEFLYVVLTAIALTGIVLYSLTEKLSWSQIMLLSAGSLLVIWAIVFTFVEVQRIAGQSQKSIVQSFDEADDWDLPRRVVVEPPTDEPCPHHEDHAGSEGLDQGQLTSQLSGTTPLIAELRDRAQRKKRAS